MGMTQLKVCAQREKQTKHIHKIISNSHNAVKKHSESGERG